MREQNATENGGQTTLPAIAPWWHTVLLIVPLLSFSVLGSLKPAHHALSQHHIAQYIVTLAWEWILAALVLLGHPYTQNVAAAASRHAPPHFTRLERRSRLRRSLLDRIRHHPRSYRRPVQDWRISQRRKKLSRNWRRKMRWN